MFSAELMKENFQQIPNHGENETIHFLDHRIGQISRSDNDKRYLPFAGRA
jgi:hypothetical protein